MRQVVFQQIREIELFVGVGLQLLFVCSWRGRPREGSRCYGSTFGRHGVSSAKGGGVRTLPYLGGHLEENPTGAGF